jgi:hypothetical protein
MQTRMYVSTALVVALVAPDLIHCAVRGNKAAYVGGTVKTISPDAQGYLSLDDNRELVFSPKEGDPLKIPYKSITSMEFGQKVGRRVGTTIALGATTLGLAALPMLFSKKKKHFLTIGYANAAGENEAIVLELAKDIVRSTLPILEARTGRQVEAEGESESGKLNVTELRKQQDEEPQPSEPPKRELSRRAPKAEPLPTQEEAPKGITVRFTSAPAGADVLINGEYWGRTPTIDLTNLPAGTHAIVVKKMGYLPWERSVMLAPGDERAIVAELELKPNDPTKPRVTGN